MAMDALAMSLTTDTQRNIFNSIPIMPCMPGAIPGPNSQQLTDPMMPQAAPGMTDMSPEMMDQMMLLMISVNQMMQKMISVVQIAIGYEFRNTEKLGEALRSAHRDRFDGTNHDGNRSLAGRGITVIQYCIRVRSAVRGSDNWRHAQSIYQRFLCRDDLAAVGLASGIADCIARSPRQSEAVPRVIRYAMRAIIAAVYEDSGENLNVVCGVMDNLQRFLPISTDTLQSDLAATPSTATDTSNEQAGSRVSQLSPFVSVQSSASDDISIISPSMSSLDSVSSSVSGTLVDDGTTNQPFAHANKTTTVNPFDGMELQIEDFGDWQSMVDLSSLQNPIPHDGIQVPFGQPDYMDDTAMPDAPDCSNQGGGQSSHQSRLQTQNGKRKSSCKSKKFEELEKYINQQREAARLVGFSPGQGRLFRNFDQVFPRLKQPLKDTHCITWKFYLALTSPYTVMKIKKALAALKTESSEYRDVSNLNLQSLYNLLKRQLQTGAISAVRVRYNIYQFYKKWRGQEGEQLDEGHIVETSESFGTKPVSQGPGNPHHKRQFELFNDLVYKVEPEFGLKSEKEQDYLKNQIGILLNNGKRLSALVKATNDSEGILCLLPFPADLEGGSSCMAASINDLIKPTNEQFDSLLKALRTGPDLIKQFCRTAEQVLYVLVSKWSDQGGSFRMSHTESSEILQMIHGSEQLLDQLRWLRWYEQPSPNL